MREIWCRLMIYDALKMYPKIKSFRRKSQIKLKWKRMIDKKKRSNTLHFKYINYYFCCSFEGFSLLSLLFTPLEFYKSVLADGFSLEFEWSKSSQVSRTLLSILAVLNNAVVWIVSTRPPTSKSSRPFNNPLVTVPNAQITIGTIVTFMFHIF